MHLYLVRGRDNFGAWIVEKLRQNLDGEIGDSDGLDFACHAKVQSSVIYEDLKND